MREFFIHWIQQIDWLLDSKSQLYCIMNMEVFFNQTTSFIHVKNQYGHQYRNPQITAFESCHQQRLCRTLLVNIHFFLELLFPRDTCCFPGMFDVRYYFFWSSCVSVQFVQLSVSVLVHTCYMYLTYMNLAPTKKSHVLP